MHDRESRRKARNREKTVEKPGKKFHDTCSLLTECLGSTINNACYYSLRFIYRSWMIIVSGLLMQAASKIESETDSR